MGEWTGRVEIIEEEIPGSKRSVSLSSVFSTDGTSNSAPAAPRSKSDTKAKTNYTVTVKGRV